MYVTPRKLPSLVRFALVRLWRTFSSDTNTSFWNPMAGAIYAKFASGTSFGYTGQRNKAGQEEGRGTFRTADGAFYEGEWRNGELEGFGTFRYADGNVYEGEWKHGKREGRGTFRTADGTIYVGEWKAGKKDGHGVLAIGPPCASTHPARSWSPQTEQRLRSGHLPLTLPCSPPRAPLSTPSST